MDLAPLRPIVDLLPCYAHQRRAGWTPERVVGLHITLPEYLLLRRVAIEGRDDVLTLGDLQANALNPYSTVDPFLDDLPHLVDLNVMSWSGDVYTLTTTGIEVLKRGESSANDHAASRLGLPAVELDRLAEVLQGICERQRLAPEPEVKSHQDRVPILRRFDPRQSPAVVLEYALYALQRARDDAHMAAWRRAGFLGPPIELLSRVWAGEESTVGELSQLTRGRIRPDEVEQFVHDLARGGYLELNDASVTITPIGRAVRDDIERETDRVYFAPWPQFDAGWVRAQIETIAANLARTT